MPHSRAWDEAKPAGTDLISAGDDEIRAFKLDIRERMALNHTWNVDTTDDGLHTKIQLQPPNNVTVIRTEDPNAITTGPLGIIDLGQTWNDPASALFGLKLSIVNTSSGAASRLISLNVDGIEVFGIDVTGALTSGGSAVFEDGIQVHGLAQFHGMTNIAVTGELVVQGPTTQNGTLSVGGTAYFGDIANFAAATVFQGPVTVEGGLSVAILPFNCLTSATFASTVGVIGLATFFGGIAVNGDAEVSGDTTLEGTLDVDGIVTFDSATNIAGPLTLTGGLAVSGFSQFNSDAAFVQAVTVMGAGLTVTNQAYMGEAIVNEILTLNEMTPPVFADPNTCRLFAQDNGAGKTQLMVLFPTGSAIQLAIEA